MLLLPLLGLVVGAGIAAALFQALSDDVPGSPAEAAELEQQPAGTIAVDAAGYLGRPVEVVTEELAALGLDVRTRQVPTDDSPPGVVTDVTPDGELQPGDPVVVAYTVRPGSGGAADEGTARTGTAVDPGGSAPGADVTDGGTPAPTTSAAPSASPSPSPSPAPATTSPSGSGDATGPPTGGPGTAPGSGSEQPGTPTSSPPDGSSAPSTAPTSGAVPPSSSAAPSSSTSAPPPSTGARAPGTPSGTGAGAEETGG